MAPRHQRLLSLLLHGLLCHLPPDDGAEFGVAELSFTTRLRRHLCTYLWRLRPRPLIRYGLRADHRVQSSLHVTDGTCLPHLLLRYPDAQV